MRETDEQREERERERLHVALGLLQIGGVGLLAVMAAGLVPRLLAAWYPPLAAGWIGLAVGSVAALIAVGLAVARVWRTWRDAPPRDRS